MLEFDFHVHSIASGHAFSTLREYVMEAKDRGIKGFALTDHGPGMNGAPHLVYFTNLQTIPTHVEGVRIFKGCEANVMNYKGDLDIGIRLQKNLEIVLAGIHPQTNFPQNGTRSNNTKAITRALEKNRIHIVTHPYAPNFSVEISEVIKAANDNNVIIELNLSQISRYSRNDNFRKNIDLVIENAVKNEKKISISTDAHVYTQIGDDGILSRVDLEIPDSIVFGEIGGMEEIEDFLKSKTIPND